MSIKWYKVALVVLIVLLAGSWGYFGWHNSKEQKKAEAVVAQDLQSDPPVKKSSNGICHDKTSRWYSATQKFEAFDNIQLCLDSGGRLPY